MIKRLVLFRLKEAQAEDENLGNAIQIKRSLESLRGKIPGMLHLEVGIDVNRGAEASDVALYAEFENQEALELYTNHPEHQRVRPLVHAMREERRVVDYEI